MNGIVEIPVLASKNPQLDPEHFLEVEFGWRVHFSCSAVESQGAGLADYSGIAGVAKRNLGIAGLLCKPLTRPIFPLGTLPDRGRSIACRLAQGHPG